MSFEAAGRYLGIGKSAVHKQVHSVDDKLGVSVFRHDGHGMVPTEAGNIYLPEARESVRHTSLGVDRVHAFLRVQTNNLRVGYSTYLNTRLLDIVRRIHPRGLDPKYVTRESLLTH
jgi:DNA-binding transcriptional LysR family regulator